MGNLQVRSESFYRELWTRCETLATSTMVPKHFQNRPGDLFLVAEYAHTQGEPILAMLRSTYVVHGSLGFTAAYMIAKANTSGIFRGPLRYEEGDGWCQCWAILEVDGERVEGPKVTMEMAKAEGWTSNKKYQTMQPLMLRYRAATFFVRLVSPEAMLGFQTVDELEDLAASGQLEPRNVEAEKNVDNAIERLDSLTSPAVSDFPENGDPPSEGIVEDEA